MAVPAIVPFLPMIGQAIGSGIQAIGGARSAKQQAKFFGDLKEQGEASAKQAKKARDSYGLGDTYRRFLNMSLQDPTADLRRQQEERRQASSLGALQSGGARALIGGLQAQAQGASDRMASISANEARRRAQAFQTVGQAEQSVLRNKAMFADRDLTMARQQAAQGLRGQFEADQQRRQAIRDGLSGLAEVGGKAAAMGYGMKNDLFTSDDLLKSMFGTAKHGMKTPGEFSHESNPIDMVQGGVKVGEATGGEYVINPDQARKISQQSAFARKLFRKFDKEAS